MDGFERVAKDTFRTPHTRVLDGYGFDLSNDEDLETRLRIALEDRRDFILKPFLAALFMIRAATEDRDGERYWVAVPPYSPRIVSSITPRQRIRWSKKGKINVMEDVYYGMDERDLLYRETGRFSGVHLVSPSINLAQTVFPLERTEQTIPLCYR